MSACLSPSVFQIARYIARSDSVRVESGQHSKASPSAAAVAEAKGNEKDIPAMQYFSDCTATVLPEKE